MDIQLTSQILKQAIEANVPVMMWGPPGVGKSDILHQVAAEVGYKVLDLRLAQIDPTDLRGIPVPDRDKGVVDWFTPSFWPTEGCDPTIIFLDELDKAPISVKNASLQLVLDRCIGEYVLPNNCAIVAAGNREEDNTHSIPLGSALTNRMIHVDVESDVDVWVKWAIANEVNEDIVAYIISNPQRLYKNTGHHAFPSPRSWVAASRISSDAPNDLRYPLVGAAVGESIAAEFKIWNRVYRNTNPEAILKGEMPNFDKLEDQSHKYAVTLAVAFYAKKKGVDGYEDGISTFLDLLSPEMRVTFLRYQTPEGLGKLAAIPALKQVIADVMDLL